jgi:hemin uptake protein HemP
MKPGGESRGGGKMISEPGQSISLGREKIAVEAGSDGRVLDSQMLFGGAREIRISHNGESYLLRLTRLGKLILTK